MTEASGPTWDYANKGLWQQWKRRGGDWSDLDGVPYGTKPFASARVGDSSVWTAIDATKLVKRLIVDNTGMFITGTKPVGGGWAPKFNALPDPNAAKLKIVTDAGTFDLRPVTDTWINNSTNRSMSADDLWSAENGILMWDFSSVSGAVQRATLSVFSGKGFYGPHDIHLWRLDLPELLTNPAKQRPESVKQGLAVNGEKALCSHPSVMDCMDTSSLKTAHADCTDGTHFDDARSGIGFWPQYGLNHLVMRNNSQSATAINCRWLMSDRAQRKKPYSVPLKDTPKHIFMRYLIKVPASVCANDYLGTKLPAPSGTLADYNYTGWSGDENIPYNSQWGLSIDMAEPCVNGMLGLIPYAYHQDNTLTNPNRGSVWSTNAALIAGREDPYSIEIEIKINTVAPGPSGSYNVNHDGVMRMWVDGVPVFEKLDIAWSGHPNANVLSAVWLIMHGGNGAPRGTNAYELGAMVIAREYIGPPQKLP